MILDSLVKVGELAVRATVLTTKAVAPVVIKGAKASGRFGAKEVALAKVQAGKSSEIIKKDYEGMQAKIAEASDGFADAFAKFKLEA